MYFYVRINMKHVLNKVRYEWKAIKIAVRFSAARETSQRNLHKTAKYPNL